MSMTRDEQVTEATEYYYNDIGLRVAFEEGAQWADEHPKSPWISVKERLPEEDTDVFVRKACTNGIFHLVGKVLNKGKWYCYGFGWQDSEKITHRMPIPELKKGE